MCSDNRGTNDEARHGLACFRGNFFFFFLIFGISTTKT